MQNTPQQHVLNRLAAGGKWRRRHGAAAADQEACTLHAVLQPSRIECALRNRACSCCKPLATVFRLSSVSRRIWGGVGMLQIASTSFWNCAKDRGRRVARLDLLGKQLGLPSCFLLRSCLFQPPSSKMHLIDHANSVSLPARDARNLGCGLCAQSRGSQLCDSQLAAREIEPMSGQ